MPEQNWLESRKKKSRRYTYIVFLMVTVAAAFIFFKNNHELLFSKPGRLSQTKPPLPPLKPAAVNRLANPAARATTIAVMGHSAVRKTDSVTIADFFCRLRGNEAFRIVLSLNLIFPSGALNREILLKREDLKVMVQKIIAEKSMNELIVDSLRNQTKRAMNQLLEKGAISDVEFRNFSIEKVQ
jgi:flagellar basal body-associated protein FliL